MDDNDNPIWSGLKSFREAFPEESKNIDAIMGSEFLDEMERCVDRVFAPYVQLRDQAITKRKAKSIQQKINDNRFRGRHWEW